MTKLAKLIFNIVFVLGTVLFMAVHVQVNAQNLHYSQNGGKKRNKLVDTKVEYLSRQLNLTDAEGKKFWPLYKQYQQQLVNVRRLKRLNNTNAPNGTEQINKELYYETELVNIRKRYQDAFLKILSPEKVSELYKSEREFNEELVKQLSERSERAGD
jgi:hypothetical protein